ncbi:hypothetical protein GCM10025876_28030 [Demequina litorisediminis]|uniref:Uncharacterized protein n=1 Tax=Demequina litorisediminis TaxID=1849022 RepID=A0ABQ6IIR6_9MICO|nr:hypothetical protein GCM10025876_28030 [Demequina litorisediminis]
MIAAIDNALDTRSNPPSAGPRDSGSSHAPAMTRMTTTGTLMRNTEPHQKCSSSAPPTRGPTASPLAAAADQMAIARVRSVGSGKTLRISDRVEGIRVAPATPRSSRAAMSISGLDAVAARIEAAPKPVAPISRRRLRPMRSARLPIVTRRPAMASE